DAKQRIKSAAPPAKTAARPAGPELKDAKPVIPGFSDAAAPAVGDSANAPPAEGKSDNPPTNASSESAGFAEMLDKVLHTGAMGLMLRGGIFMWPILFCGILATGVIIERYRSLKMLTTDASGLR